MFLIGFVALFLRQCLDTRQPGTDLSNLNAQQFEIFKGFCRKGNFKRSGSIQYLFRIAELMRTIKSLFMWIPLCGLTLESEAHTEFRQKF